MDDPKRGQGAQPQPTWTVAFDDGDAEEVPPSRFVEVHVTHQLEVNDLAALQAAVEALDGPLHDDVDRRLRQIPAVLIGRLIGGLPLPDLPGVVQRSSGLSVGEYAPESDA